MVHINVTKNRKPLIIPLNADIKKILQEYLKYRKGEANDYLFCNVYSAVTVETRLLLDVFNNIYRLIMVLLTTFFAYDSAKAQLKKTNLTK